MPKVLSIVPYKIFPAKLGGQKGIALFNEYLAKEMDLVCVTVRSNDPIFAKGYLVLNILSDSFYRYINPVYFFTIKKLIQQHRATHLLLEHPYYGWLGILLKWATGVKLIVHSHNVEATRWKSLGKWWWKILWLYERTTHRIADYNFFIQDEDRSYALREFRLKPDKCTTITYGIEMEQGPTPEERKRCKQILQQHHSIGDNETIYLFNGALDYKPNLEGVQTILQKINPILLNAAISYKIIICGRGLPAQMNELKEYADKNITYAGFVDDITIYFKGADIFINPIAGGGGIKTKLVEALGYNSKVVSTQSGSIGVSSGNAGQHLFIVPDHSWTRFAEQMIQANYKPDQKMPDEFYITFYWGNISRKAAAFIT